MSCLAYVLIQNRGPRLSELSKCVAALRCIIADMLLVTAEALDFALDHVERHGDTDILPPAFEFQALRMSWKHARKYLADQDLDNWSLRPSRSCLSPKGYLGYRIATQLDPLDTLLLTALIYEVGSDIEKARVPSDRDTVFSHRFKPDDEGSLFSNEITYDTFRLRSLYLANNNQDGWVVLTDIADFYMRLYSHPLENTLNQAISRDHARVIFKLLKQLNQRVSHGIPVGPSATRLLAELAITDIDSFLLGNQVVYCRYSDDFRIFAGTRLEALEHLALLARTLYANHGLTLQQAKTHVIPVTTFTERSYDTTDQGIRQSLDSQFEEWASLLGLDPYGLLDPEDLDREQREELDEFNLTEVLTNELTRDEPINLALIRFVLKRLAQVGEANVDLAALLVDNVERLIPVFRDMVALLGNTTLRNRTETTSFMNHILVLLDNPDLSHLEYYRIWLLKLLEDNRFNHRRISPRLFDSFSDGFTSRKRSLVMGAKNNQPWIRSEKGRVFELSPWERRAFLRAASCLPKDEADSWYNSIINRLDLLDKWVVDWTRKRPLRSGAMPRFW